MTLPRSVQAQQQRADELHQSVYGALENPEGNQETQNELEQANEAEQHEEATAAPESDQQNDDQTGHADEENTLKEAFRKLDAAYRTLQGKYSNEVPVLHEKIRNLQEQLIQSQKAKEQAEQSAKEVHAELKDVQARLTEEIGEEAANAVSEYARSLLRSEMDDLKNQKPPEQTVNDNDESVNRFWSTLRRRKPNFDEINSSTAFVLWLRNPDPETGLLYQDKLNEAGRDLDVESVIDIVKQYEHDQQQATKPPAPTSPDQQIAAPKGGQRNLPPEKPSYTSQDFKTLMEQKRRGEWRGREAEFAALEREIHAALTGI